MVMEMTSTKVLKEMLKTDKRFILSVGSSRSSKTYSVYQWIILYCAQHSGGGKWISCVRKSFPSLKRSILREFIALLTELNLYSVKKHNKSSQVIELFGNFVEFFSIDDYEKVKGSKRDVAYLNEITEIDYEAANQIFLRTNEKIIMDMNPSDIHHWVWNMKDNPECHYIHSTFKDNPFLPQSVINQIMSYKDADENYWRIYGLGLPGVSQTTIYTHWELTDDIPEECEICWGLDIGFNHKTALIQLFQTENHLHFKEVISASGMTTGEILDKIQSLNIKDMIWCDSARPDIIEDLRRRRILAKGADKRVSEGIMYIKSKKVTIDSNSHSLIDEIKRYRWKSAGELILDEPVKVEDDCMDAMRYAAFSSKKKQSNGVPFQISDDDKKRNPTRPFSMGRN